MKNKWMKMLICLAPLTLSIQSVIANQVDLKVMSDQELSDTNGQALLSLSNIAPNDPSNKMSGQGIGFYKLGLEADLELNANIKKLQLGCGGVNGAGKCDIDIDHLSLSGISDTSEGRAGSSAKLTNPFLEFAIKNPNSASTREMVGIRLSAERALGMLTLGDENSATPNGINSLSGYMKINPTTGLASTAQRNMTYNDTGKKIDGKIGICLIGNTCSTPILRPTFNSDNYNLTLQSTTAPLTLNGTTISGTRMTSAQLTGIANLNQLNFSGNLSASVPLLLGAELQKVVTGNITGLKADIRVDQNLGYIHKLQINNPFSLSLQQQNVWWPGADATALQGWWMAFDDSINIGDVTPSEQIQITNDVLKQVVDPISNYITNNPPKCSNFNCIIGTDLAVGNVNLPNTRVDFPLKDLKLTNQNFAPNCYGNLKFC